jgi:hypothetical protein
VWNPFVSSAYAHIKPATEVSGGTEYRGSLGWWVWQAASCCQLPTKTNLVPTAHRPSRGSRTHRRARLQLPPRHGRSRLGAPRLNALWMKPRPISPSAPQWPPQVPDQYTAHEIYICPCVPEDPDYCDIFGGSKPSVSAPVEIWALAC